MFNNRNNRKILSLLMGALILFSCNKIIEIDITDDIPILVLPQVNDTIENNPVHFKWIEMLGATKYHLEIVSPSFANISTYNLDSIVTGSNFFFGLDSNNYEFRITAMNGAYSSKTLGPVPFVIGTSIIGPSAGVTLNTPFQNQYFNAQFDGSFSWFTLPGTNTYTFELHDGATFAAATLDYYDQISTNGINSLNGQTLGEGTYSWGVKAFLSNGGETQFSKRVFYIDTVSPGSASLNLPMNNSNSVAGNISFQWTLPADNGNVQSPVLSILQVATDAAFTSQLAPDTLSTQNATKNLTQGTYYWRIITIDQAGNLGATPTTYNILNITP